MTTPNDNDGLFTPAFDLPQVQDAVLSAALAGDPACLAELPALAGALDEPHRTMADELLRLHKDLGFVDANVLGNALEGRPLVRCIAKGRSEPVSAREALNLLAGVTLAPGQAAAYLGILREEQERRRREETRRRVTDLADRHASDPRELLEELGRLVAEQPAGRTSAADRHPSELLRLLPYVRELEQLHRGRDFLGLDSGFDHLNNLCNGLPAGLFVVTAPPAEGKTTWAWQVCCQAAQLGQVPALFVSYEQSADELRAKALARLGSLEYRQVLRGRLSFDNPTHRDQLLAAVQAYAQFSLHLTVVEADASTTVDALRELVGAKMARAEVARALLVIDYLQIIPASDAEAARIKSPKDKVDLHVSALRRLARDLGVSVLCVSSQNRAGYDSKALDAFKESGAIEYGADVAAVLWRERVNDEPGLAGEKARYKERELHMIKNRNGECGVVKFKFYPERARFVEAGSELP
jgi:replicative DNA helicase